ncbi:MAG: DUF6541 family protein [Rubrobacteraceae bacterium]|nr:hypothetical protein [Rubrobacter sp.]
MEQERAGVLPELMRALVAALIVGVAPGWFWSALLCPARDRAERFAYSVALSMALVPAVVLVPTKLFGLGVTLPMAVLSTLLVFFGGLVAYLVYGSAKGPEGLLGTEPGGLGLVVLVPVSGGLVLALGTAIGFLPFRWTLIPVSALMVVAGIAHLLASRRPTGVERGVIADSLGLRERPSASLVLLAVVLAMALFHGYSGPVLHDWPFIRGVDHYSHAVMANLMMTRGEISPYLIYPPGFHTMTAMVSRLSGLDPLEIFPVLGPALLVLPALALYALASRLWGWECGVAAAAFSVMLGGTYFYFNDAMYPNLVTSQFLLVLAVAALLRLYATPSVRSVILLALLGSSVVLYHPVASMYLALLLAPATVLFLPYLLLYERRTGVSVFAAFALLGILSVIYAWDTYDLPQAVAGMVGGSRASTTGDAVGMAVGTQAVYPMEFLIGVMTSPPVAWLGLLGVFLLAGGPRGRVGTPRMLAYMTLILWTAIIFLGSRASLTGFPQRFGRDLGVPLALLAAFAFVAVVRSLGPRRAAAVFAASLAVLAASTLVGLRTLESLENSSVSSPQMTMTPDIAEAGAWLEAHNTGGNIMVSPHANQVPSRMMLAMGDYAGLQSFAEYQVDHPRDLPPTGPQPMRDVLWVMNHPEGEKTQLLLQKHDVRYVVLYKNMPDRVTLDYWRFFASQPDLYRTVFENRDVLIVTRRDTAG